MYSLKLKTLKCQHPSYFFSFVLFKYPAFFCVFLTFSIYFIFFFKTSRFEEISLTISRKIGISSNADNRILVIYVYAANHIHALKNLRYFIRTAVRSDDYADYFFILQQVNNTYMDERLLPSLPNNAHYIHHENKCFDLGTVGWFFDTYTIGNPYQANNTKPKTILVNLRQYSYFILMNSSIRGPFFPTYLKFILNDIRQKFFWYRVFTAQISEKLKLVGCTISCSTAPHVQSYLLVTDFVGLSLLIKPSNTTGIFDCYSTAGEVIVNGEIAASTRILEAGYNIGSLQTKYQDWDFSIRENRQCNKYRNPYTDKAVDGITLDPYEILFVKFNNKGSDEASARAIVYQNWEDMRK